MAFSERDSKVRNLFSKKAHVERGTSEAYHYLFSFSSLMLQLAWGKTKKQDKQIKKKKTG